MAGTRPMDRSRGSAALMGPLPPRFLIHSTIFTIVIAVTLAGGWKHTKSIEYLVEEHNFSPYTANEGFLTKSLAPYVVEVSNSDPSSNTANPAIAGSPSASYEAARNQIVIHTVGAGDTVSGIAAKYGISIDSVRWANKLDDVDSLSIGQKLSIMPVSGILHTVTSGDTISDIANKYKADANAIVEYNKLASPDKLALDAKLIIPGGKAIETPRPQPVARSERVDSAAPAAAQPAPAAQAAPPPGAAQVDAVNFALGYLGYPYVWGGASPRGFDCSGFVSYVFNQKGIRMPRDLWGQWQASRPVSRDQLQPGDLVFFANTYEGGLSHNGIYIGGGKFVNAESERKGVTITDLNSSYWSSHYYGGRRP